MYLTKHHTMKTYWGSGGIAPRILNLGNRCRWVVSFTPRQLYPRVRAPGIPSVRGWVGPRFGHESVAKRTISIYYPCREFNPCRSARNPVCILNELPRLLHLSSSCLILSCDVKTADRWGGGTFLCLPWSNQWLPSLVQCSWTSVAAGENKLHKGRRSFCCWRS
jgi:hypothetical protein